METTILSIGFNDFMITFEGSLGSGSEWRDSKWDVCLSFPGGLLPSQRWVEDFMAWDEHDLEESAWEIAYSFVRKYASVSWSTGFTELEDEE
jgi:hypothetical protein